jgi:hypothetical protein
MVENLDKVCKPLHQVQLLVFYLDKAIQLYCLVLRRIIAFNTPTSKLGIKSTTSETLLVFCDCDIFFVSLYYEKDIRLLRNSVIKTQ